jgi:hypothetical protein
MRDFTPGQMFVGVKDQELTFQVVHGLTWRWMCPRQECSALHQTPQLKLYGKMDSSMTRVGVLARGLTITLDKQLNLFCMQLI